MKVIRFLATAALALTATTAMAQGAPPQGGGQGGAARMMEAMMKDITLTDAQKVKVDSIVAAAREETMKLRSEMVQGQPPSDELRGKMTAITTKRNDAIKAVLTAEQQTVFAKNLESMPTMGRRPPR